VGFLLSIGLRIVAHYLANFYKVISRAVFRKGAEGARPPPPLHLSLIFPLDCWPDFENLERPPPVH
jgi:hypothetical protein